MSKGPRERTRSPIEGPASLPWVVGIARIVVLLIGALGVYRFGLDKLLATVGGIASPRSLMAFLFTLYGFNLFSTFLYLRRRQSIVSRIMVWTHVLLDFSVIAATISFTGGPTSFFTFLLVVVILEAGLLLGLSQGFLFAVISSLFVATQAWLRSDGPPDAGLWYNIAVEGLSFLFTAFISGYWNHRIFRLQEFQREILDNMSSGFLITDRNGVVWAQNRAADRVLNFPEGAGIGRHVSETLVPDSGGESPVAAALRTGRDYSSYEFYAAAGPEKRMLLGLTTNCLYDTRGRRSGIIASFTDLTEVDNMRRELLRQDRLAALGALAADVAHEIRNPVAAIRGSVEELQSSVATPELASRLAAIAARECDHLNRIVSGFLDFTRNPAVERQVFDLRPLLDEVAESIRRKFAGAETLSLTVSMPDIPCNIAGDPSRIKQVFMNLSVNAVEAMNERGTLDIGLIPAQGSFEIRFEDAGPGLPPDQVARIFEPFYTTKESGVGMGLAICLRIVTAHDGTIRASARDGGGTRMTIRLPAAT